MKIAYLINAHNNSIHLSRLIKSIKTNDSDIFLHIDKDSELKLSSNNRKNVTRIKSIPVNWGGFSQVRASLNLLSEAFSRRKYDYYIFLSGLDYPVRSNKEINDFLTDKKGKNFIDIYQMPLFDKEFSRIDYYHLERRKSKILYLSVEIINRLIQLLNLKRRKPQIFNELTLYAGSNWWALTDDCVEYILNFIKNNNSFLEFYKYTQNADEMFYQTIIGNSPFKDTCLNSFTYADWNSTVKPAFITADHIRILRKEYIVNNFGNKKSYILFARKFKDSSKAVVALLEKELR